MDFIKRNKILGAAVIVLVIANVFLLTFIWLGKNGDNRNKQSRGGGQFLEEQLELTIDQKSEVKALRDSHFELMDKLRVKAMKGRTDLHNLIKEGNSQEEATKLAFAIGATQKEIEYANYYHFYEMRKLLTDDQKLIFDKTIINILKGEKDSEGPKGDRPPPRDRPDGRRPPPQRGG
jgi:Spy/CpxP family protein refolding chaperone